MPNPFEFIKEIREMNNDLCKRLDEIVERMDRLIELQENYDSVQIFYGDGK